MKSAHGEIDFFGPLLVVHGYGDAHDLRTDLIQFFGTLRPLKTNALGRRYPETTLNDIRQVIGLFEERAKRADRSALGVTAAINRWQAYVAMTRAIGPIALGSGASAFFDNDRFWTHETRRLAVRLSAERSTRPEDKTIVGSVVGSVTSLPGRIVDTVSGGAGEAADAVETVVDKVSDAADVVGNAAKDAVAFAHDSLPSLPSLDPGKWMRDLAREFKWPLIVGAGVLGAIVLAPTLGGGRSAS